MSSVKTITILLLLLTLFKVKAQDANIFYFTPNIPQSTLLNPSFHYSQSKIVAGFALINGVYADVNSEASLSDLFVVDKSSGKTIIDIDKFSSSIEGDGEIDQSFSVPLLFFAYNHNKNHFFFQASEKQPLSIYFTNDLLKIIKNGNAPYAGKEVEAQLDMHLFQYAEFAFGYSRDFLENKLSVGISAKLLMGQGAIKANDIRLGLFTHPNGDYIDVNGQGSMHFSGAFSNEGNTLNTIKISDEFASAGYFSQFNNPGFSMDIGANYQVNPKINVAFSMTDIGSIHWKEDSNTYNLNGNFRWEGVDISNSIQNSNELEESLVELTDSLSNAFTFNEEDATFKTKLTSKLYIGGTITVNEIFNIGVVNRISFYPTKNVSNMFMLSGNANFNDILSLTASYAVTNGSYDNFGVGVGVRAGFAQFILGTSNVYQLINVQEAKYASVRFGINLLFGKIEDKQD